MSKNEVSNIERELFKEEIINVYDNIECLGNSQNKSLCEKNFGFVDSENKSLCEKNIDFVDRENKSSCENNVSVVNSKNLSLCENNVGFVDHENKSYVKIMLISWIVKIRVYVNFNVK